jgi:subtilisin family serine protease
MKIAAAVAILNALCWARSVESRVGNDQDRRRLEHRKLQWAPDEVAIPQQYLIVLNDFTAAENDFDINDYVNDWLGGDFGETEVMLEYGTIYKGLVMKNVQLYTLQKIVQDERVAYVTEVSVVGKSIVSILRVSLTLLFGQDFYLYETEQIQSNPPWGLDRIDQVSLPLDKKFSYGPNGYGVEVYILDSGIRTTHNQFTGRVSCSYNFVAKSATNCEDDRGHGSHVAGTVAGLTFGVAKGAKLFAVKVLDSEGKGSLSNVVGGVDHVAAKKSKNRNQPMVINLSISGSGQSKALDDAVLRCSNQGVIVVVSAGNSKEDACGVSPAMGAGAIVVGSSTDSDSRSPFSNFGKCVHIFAPGSNIISASNAGDNDSAAKSGTSMASPHVAGAVCLYLQVNPTWNRSQLIKAIQADATASKLSSPGASSPNLLLNIAKIKMSSKPSPTRPSPPPPSPTRPSPTPPSPTKPSSASCGSVFASCSKKPCCGNWKCKSSKICFF